MLMNSVASYFYRNGGIYHCSEDEDRDQIQSENLDLQRIACITCRHTEKHLGFSILRVLLQLLEVLEHQVRGHQI